MTGESYEQILEENRLRVEWINRKLDEVKLRGERAAELQAALDATSASVWSAGRLVRATVASSGLLTDLEYAERASTIPPTRLADLTLETVRRAMAAVQDRVVEITSSEVGGDMGDAVAAQYRVAFAPSLSHLNDDTIGYSD